MTEPVNFLRSFLTAIPIRLHLPSRRTVLQDACPTIGRHTIDRLLRHWELSIFLEVSVQNYRREIIHNWAAYSALRILPPKDLINIIVLITGIRLQILFINTLIVHTYAVPL